MSSDEPTPVQGRLIDAHCDMLRSVEPRKAVYNHSVLCQTSLPYRDPGDTRLWVRSNGSLRLQIEAGYALAPDGDLTPVGLPYGPRARLVLIHVMTQAVLTRQREVELDDSLTAFARSLGLGTSGRNLRTLRDQMQRLGACSVRMVIPQDTHATVVHSPIVDALRVFTPAEPRQRTLWSSMVRLSEPFYESLLTHAVPLDPRALRALKHSASALDCYQWLAQRLHRVPSRGQLIPWESLHDQLGGGTRHLGSWRQNFVGTPERAGVLPQVLMVYPAASDAVEITDRGLVLNQAEPPVPKWGRVQQRRLLT